MSEPKSSGPTVLQPGRGAAPVRHRRPAPPTFVFPALAAWERFDRRRRHIRSIRPGGLLGLEVRRHRGAPIRLLDGTRIEPGALIGEMHFDNRRLPAFYMQHGLGGVFAECRLELRDLARWAERRPAEERPVAYHGEGFLAVGAVRVGWEQRERPRTWLVKLGDWYFRGLLARWAPGGVERLQRGRGPLHSRDVWCSHERLQRLSAAWAAQAAEREARATANVPVPPASNPARPRAAKSAATARRDEEAAPRRSRRPATSRRSAAAATGDPA